MTLRSPSFHALPAVQALALGLACALTTVVLTPWRSVLADQTPGAGPAAEAAAFSPPSESDIPDDPFGDMVKLGENIFHDTKRYASAFVGNSLSCRNCHLDSGRRPNSAPLWGAYVAYPAYRAKDGKVDTFEDRLQGCFLFSMNGKPPPLGDTVLIALESYASFLAKGAPVGGKIAGQGYVKLGTPASAPDFERGAALYAERCALCHGTAGEGQSSADREIVFPPLWGPKSYNWGAGMTSLANASGFIKSNMPLGQGGTLTDQEAWDVALFVNSHERPQDPRFSGSVAETRKKYHDADMSMYGATVNGAVLGENASLPGTVPAASP